MKKVILTVIVATFVLACSQKKTNDTEPTITTTETKPTPKEGLKTEMALETSEFKKGADLIAASDCMSCHKTDEKLIGPAYKEVANKYTSKDESMLAEKIIKGGQGNWGEIPMTAHLAVSKADATQMIKYILSLK